MNLIRITLLILKNSRNRALNYWNHYLLPKPFVFYYLYSIYETLKYPNNQQKLNRWHTRWVEFLQVYNFTINHKFDVENIIVDALSKKYSLLIQLKGKIIGFEILKELFQGYFKKVWKWPS